VVFNYFLYHRGVRRLKYKIAIMTIFMVPSTVTHILPTAVMLNILLAMWHLRAGPHQSLKNIYICKQCRKEGLGIDDANKGVFPESRRCV
jgi:hypothetical protein